MQVKFVGGHQNGRIVEATMLSGRVQPVIYLTYPLSFEEDKALKIDDKTAWKAPEEVYLYDSDLKCYIYQKTVHYKP